MSDTAERTKPKLWERVKAKITRGSKGGKPGQWSARKAQLAVAAYKAEGGGYKGGKADDNALAEWTREDWGTKSGGESGKTGERYLPKKAREALSPDEYRSTTAKKRADTREGKQFSSQPAAIAEKTAQYRDHRTRDELYVEARKRDVPGRSSMTKAELAKALAAR